MKNSFKLAALVLVVSLGLTACGDSDKTKEKKDSVTITKTVIDTAKTAVDTTKKDTAATTSVVKKDTVITTKTKKTEVKKQ